MSRLTYTSFGAIGDGVTDDFEAILKTHEYANESVILTHSKYVYLKISSHRERICAPFFI